MQLVKRTGYANKYSTFGLWVWFGAILSIPFLMTVPLYAFNAVISAVIDLALPQNISDD